MHAARFSGWSTTRWADVAAATGGASGDEDATCRGLDQLQAVAAGRQGATGDSSSRAQLTLHFISWLAHGWQALLDRMSEDRKTTLPYDSAHLFHLPDITAHGAEPMKSGLGLK